MRYSHISLEAFTVIQRHDTNIATHFTDTLLVNYCWAVSEHQGAGKPDTAKLTYLFGHVFLGLRFQTTVRRDAKTRKSHLHRGMRANRDGGPDTFARC